jgi:hypothetical protein
VRLENFVSGNGRIVHGEFKMASGEMSEEQFVDFLKATFERLRVSRRIRRKIAKSWRCTQP